MPHNTLRANEIRTLTPGDRSLLRHLGIPDAVRLNAIDSSLWYWDADSRTLHEWLCTCRACRSQYRIADAPSTRCRYRRRHAVHEVWPDVGVGDLRE